MREWLQGAGLGSVGRFCLVHRASPTTTLTQGLKFKSCGLADLGFWPRLITTLDLDVSWSNKILVQDPGGTLAVGNRRVSRHAPSLRELSTY